MEPSTRTRRIIGTRPGHWPEGRVMRASRPLFGNERIDSPFIGFTVIVDGAAVEAEEAIKRNTELDAEFVEWVDQATADAELLAHVKAEYGDEGPGLLDGLDTAEKNDAWYHLFGTVKPS